MEKSELVITYETPALLEANYRYAIVRGASEGIEGTTPGVSMCMAPRVQ